MTPAGVGTARGAAFVSPGTWACRPPPPRPGPSRCFARRHGLLESNPRTGTAPGLFELLPCYLSLVTCCGDSAMKKTSPALDVLIGAVLKLDALTGERQNVLAFIQSCYGCLVRSYDLDTASAALARLTGEEQHAVIAWAM